MSRVDRRKSEKAGHLNCFTHKYGSTKQRRQAFIDAKVPYGMYIKHDGIVLVPKRAKVIKLPEYGFFRGIWEKIKSFFWTDYK